ncbi:hypothetical protein [Promineifilum sp.]|uniref:hypothetical protein n=1 Tax=Promineifilum sp. TaxID=2664178 RepID=UPI0035B4BAD8
MNIESQITIIIVTQIVTIISLFVTNYISRRQAAQVLQDEIKTRKRIEYLERQLTEFYGPISALLSINKGILKITYDPDTGVYAKDVPPEFLRELKETVMIPNTIAIVEIIKENFHLIDSSIVPSHMVNFVVHAQVWPIYSKHGIERKKYLDRFRFPQEFAEYITATTNTLKAEYLSLVAPRGGTSEAGARNLSSNVDAK